MGDRANIVIKQNPGRDQPPSRIFFYTHWSGSELPVILQDALKRGQPRWTDESYLARIIFSEMIKDAVDDVTGYGISAYITDNSYALLVVDAETETVALEDANSGKQIGASVSFTEFVALGLADPANPLLDPWRVLTDALEAKAVATVQKAKATKNPAGSWPFPARDRG